MHPVAVICTALLGFLLFGLGLVVSLLRTRDKKLSGSSDDPGNLLTRFVRAHGNTAEYAPFFAVLFLYLGAQAPTQATLGWIVAATASRILAAGGIAFFTMARPNPFRALGALGTYITGAVLCYRLLAGT